MAAYFLTAALLGSNAETVNWRRIFIILGGFGIALAILVKVAIREPERGAMETGVKAPSGYIPLGQSFKQSNLLPRIAIFGGLMASLLVAWGSGTMSIVFVIPFVIFLVTMFLLSLQPGVMTILSIKSWWWMALGIAFASFASYAISGFQTKFLRLLEPDFSPRMFIICGTIPAIAVFLAMPLAIAAFWAPTIALHLAIGAALQLCLGVYLGPSFAIAQTLAPIKLRAMSTALFFFVLNMIALGGGPTFAGAMIDVFLGQGKSELDATRLAMYVTFGAYVLAFIFYMCVRITLPKDWAAAEARNES